MLLWVHKVLIRKHWLPTSIVVLITLAKQTNNYVYVHTPDPQTMLFFGHQTQSAVWGKCYDIIHKTYFPKNPTNLLRHQFERVLLKDLVYIGIR